MRFGRDGFSVNGTHNSKSTWHERFYLYRQTDKTGVSGTGVVAEGVRFEDGKCVLRWCVPGKPRGTTVYESIVDVMSIHGHDGATTVMWLDTEEEVPVNVTACDGPPCGHDGNAGVAVHGKAKASLGALV
jgi:hypothetical protein